mmetsp:Transcript_24192/g.41650  ORF Transcript_24192/g.41650 Transcript_24192/m.41650 type:complete len:200 (+) Transcript_24192:173-772(+)
MMFVGMFLVVLIVTVGVRSSTVMVVAMVVAVMVVVRLLRVLMHLRQFVDHHARITLAALLAQRRKWSVENVLRGVDRREHDRRAAAVDNEMVCVTQRNGVIAFECVPIQNQLFLFRGVATEQSQVDVFHLRVGKLFGRVGALTSSTQTHITPHHALRVVQQASVVVARGLPVDLHQKERMRTVVRGAPKQQRSFIRSSD